MTRHVLFMLHTVLGIAAVGAGRSFVREPSGKQLAIPAEWLEGSPFPDFRIPGLFLAVVIGGANLVSAAALWRRHPFGPALSLLTGVLLMAWITIQTAIIGFRHWSQGFWWGTFGFVTVLAARLVRQSAETERRHGGG